MLSRRVFTLVCASALLSACTEQAPIVDASTRSKITITDVVVDTSSLPVKSNGSVRSGRDLELSAVKLARDLDAAITAQVRARGLDGPVRAKMTVTPTSVALLSPGQAFAVGGRSHIEGMVSLKTSTGQVLLEPTLVKGFNDQLRMGGLIGAMTSPKAGSDYVGTVNGFANNAVRKVFDGATVGIDGSVVN